MKCEVDGCEDEAQRRSWCWAHYGRWQRHGDPTAGGIPRKPLLTAEQRFWSRVDKSGGEHACWPWTAARRPGGYGLFTLWEVRKSPINAHRVAMFFTTGEWPEIAMHLCNNPPCCNPAHLRNGTQLENVQYAAACNRMSVGPRNHQAKLTEANVREIRIRSTRGESLRSLGTAYGVADTTIHAIVTGRTWRHLK